jgi:lipoprotein-releasing system permease protein
MKLPYTLFIALRYLKSKKKHKAISFNTLVSLGGVTLGVCTLLVVLSVMSGFHEDLRKKILGVNAHEIVLSYEGSVENSPQMVGRISRVPHVVSVSPFVLGQVMVSRGRSTQGVYLRGIDPGQEEQTTDLQTHMKEGTLADLGVKKAGLPGIIMGSELAGRLGVLRGDTVRLLVPTGETGPLGMLPKVREFYLAGVFEVGMFEYDSNLVLTSMADAQDLFGMDGSITGYELKLDDIYKAPEVKKVLENELGPPYIAKDWIEMNRNLFYALKLEKATMFIILTFIILVASFNIVSTLMMNVIEKQREIAILKAMGATNRGIMAVFMIQGVLIGVVGTALGVISGYVLGYLLNRYELIKLPAEVYYLSHLPVLMKLRDFVLVSAAALVISFSATIYPAWQAAKLDPIEPLRYE